MMDEGMYEQNPVNFTIVTDLEKEDYSIKLSLVKKTFRHEKKDEDSFYDRKKPE